MAALRPCPSSLLTSVAPRRLGIGSTSHVRILGRQSTSHLQASGGRTTTALQPRHRRPIRAGNGAAADLFVFQDPDDDEAAMGMSFREDVQKIDNYRKEITSWRTSIFYMEAKMLSLHLCMVAKTGVNMASRIMDCTILGLNKQDGISLDTTKQAITMYVSILVKLAEDTSHQKFHAESMLSLLFAFRGMAAISHTLLQDTIASVKYTRDIMLDYNFIHDKDNDWREFEQKMISLEDKFREVSKSPKSYKLLRPTMEGAMILTEFFVSKMVDRLRMVLRKIPGDASRHA